MGHHSGGMSNNSLMMFVVDWRMGMMSASLLTKEIPAEELAGGGGGHHLGDERALQAVQEFVNKCAFQYWRKLY